jgi:hypothetical protein
MNDVLNLVLTLVRRVIGFALWKNADNNCHLVLRVGCRLVGADTSPNDQANVQTFSCFGKTEKSSAHRLCKKALSHAQHNDEKPNVLGGIYGLAT